MSLTQHDIWVESGAFVEKDELSPADRARHMAAEAFYEPNYGRAPLPKPSLRIRVFDWLGDAVMAAWAIASHPWAWVAAGLVAGSAFVAAALTALVVMR